MKKIVYFDEESALDYIILKDGGKKVTETITNLNGNLEGKLSVELGDILNEDSQNKVISFIKKAIFNSSFGAGARMDGDLNKAHTTTLSNTVLTDYIKKANRDNKVEKLKNIRIEIYPNSMAYYRLYTPYMELIDGSKNDTGIDFKIFDKVLNNVKGYIEVASKKNNDMIVLRFNNTTFRGNYKLSDILKMNLDIYAIKVGNIDKYKLDLNNELKMSADDMTAEEILNKKTKSSKVEIDVYDVVLAGVTDE